MVRIIDILLLLVLHTGNIVCWAAWHFPVSHKVPVVWLWHFFFFLNHQVHPSVLTSQKHNNNQSIWTVITVSGFPLDRLMTTTGACGDLRKCGSNTVSSWDCCKVSFIDSGPFFVCFFFFAGSCQQPFVKALTRLVILLRLRPRPPRRLNQAWGTKSRGDVGTNYWLRFAVCVCVHALQMNFWGTGVCWIKACYWRGLVSGVDS